MRRIALLALLALALPCCIGYPYWAVEQAHREEQQARQRMLRRWRDDGMTEPEILAKIKKDEPGWWWNLEQERLAEVEKARIRAHARYPLVKD